MPTRSVSVHGAGVLAGLVHVPLVPVQDVRWTPLIVLTAVAAGLICLGIAGFRRRDVH